MCVCVFVCLRILLIDGDTDLKALAASMASEEDVKEVASFPSCEVRKSN